MKRARHPAYRGISMPGTSCQWFDDKGRGYCGMSRTPSIMIDSTFKYDDLPVMTSFQRVNLVLFTLLVLASESGINAEGVDYERSVKSVLKERCFACHGVLKQEGNLRLDTVEFMVSGGDSGSAIVPGEAKNSLLIERITDGPATRMPPEGEPLSQEEIEAIRRWVSEGAKAPTGELPEPDPAQHWAFQKPESRVPDSQRGTTNPIDVLLQQHHKRHGLTAASRLDRSLLLRRVTIDLTGLPPTPAELEAFLNDQRQDAYERLVDRLLESPQFGERWGRHWMDVWRYSDWSGEENNQVRGSPQYIWRWRDWIIEALNEDIGYDEMIRLMLAADEFVPEHQSSLRATGFLARNWYKFNRDVWLEDTVEHTGKAFLGLTFNCAKCHDHKYDPISQQNYYQFRSIFEPHDIQTDPLPGEPDIKKDGLVRVVDTHLETPTYLYERGDANRPDKSQTLSPAIPAVFQTDFDVQSVSVPEASKARISSGRRKALAEWLTDRSNPLTARVAVNHIWLRHFGAPIVGSMTDFGLRTDQPEFLDILDALAVHLMDSEWSLKDLHRLIVTSDAYCMDSRFETPTNIEHDPDNQLLWKMNSRRLEGEVVRDSVLSLAGSLDLTQGGPEIALDQSQVSRRRSLYFRHGHERQVPFLATFDGANVMDCYRRNVTIVPQQALALSNDLVVREQSRSYAAQLTDELSSQPHSRMFIDEAFKRILCRKPSNLEMEYCQNFLIEQARLIESGKLTYPDQAPDSLKAAANDSVLRARQSLVHVLFNHNDFVTIR